MIVALSPEGRKKHLVDPVLSPDMIHILMSLGGITTRLESAVTKLEISSMRRRREDQR